MLPQLWESAKYSNFYRQRKAEGDYLILDNGVAEGVKLGSLDYVDIIRQVGPDEFVLPDVMGDCDRTIEAARDFLSSIPGKFSVHDIKMVGVLQGKTHQELFKCLGFYASIGVQVIAVPRILNKIMKHKMTRITFIESMVQKKLEHFVYDFSSWHCLGSSNWIQEVAALVGTGCRSIDTCLPISLALHGLSIEDNSHRDRLPDYFNIEAPTHGITRKLIEHNIDTYLTLAGAKRFDWETETPTSEV